MERQHNSDFESAFQGAFHEAEVTPGAGLWGKIEADLEKQKSSGYKKRLLFFQLMAAASFALAMTVGGLLISENYFNTNNGDSISLNENKLNSEEDQGNTPVDNKNEIKSSSKNTKQSSVQGSDIENDNKTGSEKAKSGRNNLSDDSRNKSDNPNTVIFGSNSEEEEKLSAVSDIEVDSNTSNLSLFASKVDRLFNFLETDGLSQLEPEMVSWLAYTNPVNKEQIKNNSSLWTGLNMAAGSFAANANGNSTNSLSPNLSSEDGFSGVRDPALNLGEERMGGPLVLE